jgi:hypothetical protein
MALAAVVALVTTALAASPSTAAPAASRPRAGASGRLFATLADPGGGRHDQFGYAVAVSGSTAIVGAGSSRSRTGAAYIYEKGKAGWPTRPTVTLADPGDSGVDAFGISVAISGTTAIVAARGAQLGTGMAYIYVEGPAGWPTTPTVTLSHPATTQQFGISVAISGTTAIVGSLVSGSAPGAAFVYVEGQSGWPTTPTATFSDPSPTTDQLFGGSVAVSGDTAVVASESTHAAPGCVYLYVESGSSWPTTPTLTLPDPGTDFDYFGAAVAISGPTLVVGAYNEENGGAAFVYMRGQQAWPTRPSLAWTEENHSSSDLFGFSVAIAGTTALIGGYGTDDTGSATLYVEGSDGWPASATKVFTDPVGAPNDSFGFSVGVTDTTALIGADASHAVRGAAYLYRV